MERWWGNRSRYRQSRGNVNGFKSANGLHNVVNDLRPEMRAIAADVLGSDKWRPGESDAHGALSLRPSVFGRRASASVSRYGTKRNFTKRVGWLRAQDRRP